MPQALYMQISLLAALVNIVLAVVVLAHNPRRHLNRAFFLMAFSMFGWNLFAGLSGLLAWEGGGVLAAMFLTFVPVTCYHFVLSFVSTYQPKRWRLLKSSYGVGALVVVLLYLAPGWAPYWYGWFCLLSFPPLFSMGMYRLVQRLSKTLSPVERTQLAYILAGGAVGLSLAASDIMAFLGFGTYPLSNLGSFFFPVLIAFVIVRFGLLDLGVMVGRGLSLLILATVIYLFYRIVGFWFGETPFAVYFNVVLAAFFLMMTFNPLLRVMQNLADRFVQKDAYLFQEQLGRLSKDIISIIDQQVLFRHTYETLARSERLKDVALFILDQEERWFRQIQPVASGPSRKDRIEADSSLAMLLRESPRVLIQDEIARDLSQLWMGQDRRKHFLSVQRTLNWQGMDFCVPMSYRNKLRGLVFLSLKANGPLPNRRERDLLLALGGQLAVSLDNARIYNQMSEQDRLAALGEMAAGLAHEIRNPLGAIKGAAQFLLSGDRPPDEADFLRIIIMEADRLNAVLHRFLVFARPGERAHETVDLVEVAQRAVAVLHAPGLAEETRIQLTPPPEADQPLLVEANADELQQVLLNLLLNARQAVEQLPTERRTITVSFARRLGSLPSTPAAPPPSSEAIVSIHDLGHGMSPETVKKIFTPFFTTREEGTGLGLPICQRIVQDYSGRIDVESEEGVGSTFQVVLPLVRPNPAHPEESV